MALMPCPECGKEISDAARSCPHCGYAINTAPANPVRRTPLTIRTPSHAYGVFLIAVGMCAGLGSVFLCFVLLPLGVLGLIACGVMVGFGMNQFNDQQKGACPYCGNEVMLPANGVTCKCPHCHKTSTKKDNYLETID